MTRIRTSISLLAVTVPLVLAGCGGSSDGTVGGTLSGLSTGASVGLLDNGTDALTVSGNGSFTFATSLGSSGSYSVTVATQPVGETCIVTDGIGTLDANDDPVSSVTVTCSTALQLSGSVSGLAAGTSVELSNGTVLLPLATNGAFSFPGTVGVGTVYSVTVATQPAGESCTVTNGSGTVTSAGVPSIIVTCF